MHRRDFLKTSLASSGMLVFGGYLNCSSSNPEFEIFPKGKPPRTLISLPVSKKPNWHEQVTLTCFQGLINRRETRIFLSSSKVDQFWLEYYREQFESKYEQLENPYAALAQFRDEINGYIIYDPEMPHSINLATIIGSLQNVLPVHPGEEFRLREVGLKPVDDLRGRWLDYFAAYEWALENLQPKCHPKLIGNLCVHHPHWPSSTVLNRDYIIAHKIFTFDLSTSERDKADYQLVKKIYQAYAPGAQVLGWHCVRDSEHEAIAAAATFGHSAICALNTSNLTVHSSIRLKSHRPFAQRAIVPEKLKLEDKVYIAFMATDGDAAWFMQNLIKKDWANPAHGRMKYNWGFLPLAYQLMPGIVQYYLKNSLPTDYFVAGPSGAAYTYPHLHPNPEKFLKLTGHFMQQCGLRTVHITNWNDRDWWQEAEVPGFRDLLEKNIPEAIGFVRGMGESAFEKSEIGSGKPYIFCGEGLHRGDDLYLTLRNFINACPNRPLFIFCLVNHAIPISDVYAAIKRFPQNSIEPVHLDELLLRIDRAYQAEKISTDLYPEKVQLRNNLAIEAAEKWDRFISEIISLEAEISGDENDYRTTIQATPAGVEKINLADFLAFTVIWQAMTLVKLNLESRFFYVNHKPTATEQFLTEFAKLPDVQLITELQTLWNNWHQTEIKFDQALEYARRLVALTARLAELYQFNYQE